MKTLSDEELEARLYCFMYNRMECVGIDDGSVMVVFDHVLLEKRKPGGKLDLHGQVSLFGDGK